MKSGNPKPQLTETVVEMGQTDGKVSPRGAGSTMNQPCKKAPMHIRLELPSSLGQACRMADGDFDISYTAKLARIELTEAEQAEFGSQLADVLQYVEKLEELDVDGVSPTAHPVPLTNVTRADEVGESISTEEALRNAPAQANNLFLVPKIVE